MFNPAAYDLIVVGAGLSGASVARALADTSELKIAVLELRSQAGGNCADYRNEAGIFIHSYGPHIFHTSSQAVWDFLSQFTPWATYTHKVLGFIPADKFSGSEDLYVDIPFNLANLSKLYDADKARQLRGQLLSSYGYGARISVLDLLSQEEEPQLKELADDIYRLIFEGYSSKQWGIDPRLLDRAIFSRVPILLTDESYYFDDMYQALPLEGYSTMIERMLDHPSIDCFFNYDASEHLSLEGGNILIDGTLYAGLLVYTAPLDELFSYDLGSLGYRAVRFEFEKYPYASYQRCATINYPCSEDFTRITEFKKLGSHFAAGSTDKQGSTIILREYPQAYKPGGDLLPAYPIQTQANAALYSRYRRRAEQTEGLYLLGRLAEYRYYDMDDAVAAALMCAEQIRNRRICESR